MSTLVFILYDWTKKTCKPSTHVWLNQKLQPFNPCMIEQKTSNPSTHVWLNQKNLQPFYPCMIEQKNLATLQPMYDWTKNLQPFNPCMIEQQQKQKHNLQPFNPKEDDNIFAIIVIVQFNNKV